MCRWTVVITSGRPSKAELLARLVLKAGCDVVYLPAVEVESAELGDVAELMRWAEVVIFLTGQSVWGLAEGLKAEALREKVVLCRGSKAAGNVKTYFGINCINVGETTEGLLRADIYSGRKVLISFYGVVDQELVEKIREKAAEVRVVQAYRTKATPRENAIEAARRAAAGGHILVFTSALGASAFFQTAKEVGLLEAVVDAVNSGKSKIAAIGPVTEREVRKYGVAEVIKPEKPFLSYLAQELAKLF